MEAPNRPDYLGYALQLAPDAPARASRRRPSAPSSISPSKPGGSSRRPIPNQEFVPLPVASLVESADDDRRAGRPEALAHSSGQVFDIELSSLPPAELECLRLVLDDLGWDGYLGFVEEGRSRMHIGCSPGFARVLRRNIPGSAGRPVRG